MAKKDKKTKSAEQKARVAAKQSKKAAQKEKKTKSKAAVDSDADEDLESVLEEYARKNAQFLKVEESVCEPPSPRSSSTIVGSPSNAKELFLFGGEYFNGAIATFFNDLFVYHVERDEWRLVTSPNSPLPRSGHACCRGGIYLYLFGGEFSSLKQGKFYHYSDFWRLDPSSREWTRLECKGKSPPARSGHRMTYFKNFIILFGGFQDTSQHTKYLQDLWLYDCQKYVWYNPSLPPATQKPDARSSFSFLPHDSGAVMYGGYSRVKATSSTGNKAKGGNQASKVTMKPVVYQDAWLLRLVIPPQETPSSSIPPSIRWERRKKPVNAPNPARAGATQAYHKGRGILFGGVHDVEESEEGIDSEFFNQLFAWNIDRNRFFPLTLRRPKAAAPKKMVEARENRNRGQADEAELLRNLAALESKGTIKDAGEMDLGFIEKKSDPAPAMKPIMNSMPHPRFNAQITVQNDTLYMFGGTFEKGDREYTFADMYAVDLSKMDGVTEIYKNEIENWQEDHDGSESESDEDDESDSEDEESDEMSGVTLISSDASTAASTAPVDKPEIIDEAEEESSGNAETAVTDSRPHPRPFESLRDFFIRTSIVWQELVLKDSAYSTESSHQSVKEMKKAAFEVAETKWWDSREEIIAEEEIQEEAGIGEVVSIADRSREGGRR